MQIKYPRTMTVRLSQQEFNLIKQISKKESWTPCEFLRNSVRTLISEYLEDKVVEQ